MYDPEYINKEEYRITPSGDLDQWESAKVLAYDLENQYDPDQDTVQVRYIHGPLAMTVVLDEVEVEELAERLGYIAAGPGAWQFLVRRTNVGDSLPGERSDQVITIYSARDRFDQ